MDLVPVSALLVLEVVEGLSGLLFVFLIFGDICRN